jgi:hypothetical protein
MLCTWQLLPYLCRMQDLEQLAMKFLETARKLPSGQVRHEIFKEIGLLRVRIYASRNRGAKSPSMNKRKTLEFETQQRDLEI